MNWTPSATVPLSEDDRKAWEARIDRAERKRKTYEKSWEEGLKRYSDSKANKYDVNALKDFTHVETKKYSLNFETPDVQLHPLDPENPEVPSALLAQRQKVLNHQLGPDGADLKANLDETLFDCLAPSGFLIVEIGYDVRTAKDPITGIDVPIWGKAFASRVSPKKFLAPDDFRSTQFDKASWLGVKGTMPLTRAKREFKLPEDFTATAQQDDSVFKHGDHTETSDPLVEYTKVWYRAEDYDDSIVNPELYRLLVLVKGLDKEARHIDSPFQMVDEIGQLTPMSMRGNPIHAGTLRDLSDSAYVDSDLTVGEQLSTEINAFRTTNIRNKNARIPITEIDPQGFPAEEIEKIKNGEKVVFTQPGVLMAGQQPIQVANMGSTPRDDYTAQEYAERDREMALGTGAPQVGQASQKKTTATESRIVQGNSSARSEGEKGRFRKYLVGLVRKFDSVLAWTMTEQDLARILGTQGAALWSQWRELAGCYVYKILPDSGIHVDAAQFRAQKLDEYNLLRKDPQVNATELLTGVVRALGYDPAKTVLPQAPESGPEPLKTNMSFKGEDLIGMQSQAVVEILTQMGITISPMAIEALKAAQMVQAQAGAPIMPNGAPQPPAPHGGSADTTEPLNKHSSERTGGVNGVGV